MRDAGRYGQDLALFERSFTPVHQDVEPAIEDLEAFLLAGMETYDSAIEMEQTSRTFGVELTSLETFVREQVASQPA